MAEQKAEQIPNPRDKIEVSYGQRMDRAEWENFYGEEQGWNLYTKIMSYNGLKVRHGPKSFEKAIMVEGANGVIYSGVAEGDLDVDRMHPDGNPVVHLNFLVREDQTDGYQVPGLDEKMKELDFQPRGEPRRIRDE